MLPLDAERTSMKRTMLYEYIAEPEAGLLDDVLKQYWLLALR
jgi:hypothetical protein